MTIYRLPDVVFNTRLSRATIYRLESRGMFPSRRQLSANAVGWLASEVDAWIAARPSATGKPEVRS